MRFLPITLAFATLLIVPHVPTSTEARFAAPVVARPAPIIMRPAPRVTPHAPRPSITVPKSTRPQMAPRSLSTPPHLRQPDLSWWTSLWIWLGLTSATDDEDQ